MPQPELLGGASVGGVPLGPWLAALNQLICKHVRRDARNLQIGHSYLMTEEGKAIADYERFLQVLREDLVPLLEEYCYEDYATLARILGPRLVDVQGQRIRQELFDPTRAEELRVALMQQCPEVDTAAQAVSAAGVEAPDPDEDEA